MTALAPVADPTRDYGTKVAAVEPGGVEPIPLDERHGSPLQLVWTWASPNLEFATVFVGVIGVLYFGQSFTQAAFAIILGTALGATTQGVLSTWGPPGGRAQMVLSRSGFGFLGNILPAGLNALTAGIGWFAVNSVSGALALSTLTGMPKALGLVIVVVVQIVVAFFGHNLVQVFERYAFPFLAVVFLVACLDVFGKSHVGAAGTGGMPSVGAFLVELSAAFGYAAGWNPYASDYTRYLPATVRRLPVALCAAAGIFVSCTVLELAGAASATIATNPDLSPTGAFTSVMPTWLGDLTLIAIALGAVSANVLNIYSGAMSFLALGIELPFAARRAIIALVFGAIGFVVALVGLDHVDKYENFLLVIAYWIAPWLGVVFVDRFLRRNTQPGPEVYASTYRNWAGPIAMLVGGVVSIWLFCDQTQYLAPIPKNHPSVGDITPYVGFLIAAVLYAVLAPVLANIRRTAATAE